ncbi:cobalt-precorrin-5B (C1)-methyltransferase [Clostridiales Family XIII bacterium PM5-7]
MDQFAVVGGKSLRRGYTTGSCATATATAATEMLLSHKEITEVTILLPSGDRVLFHLGDIVMRDDYVSCSTVKDGGDDPDATHGAKIVAKVSRRKDELQIKGGVGIGKVTAKGLQIPPGEWAINPVPRKMIKENVCRVMKAHGYHQGLEIEISVPEGETIAKRTFNPRMGIIDGISILGTTGIVEPMSEKALVDTVKSVIDQRYIVDPQCILISPGNYGKDFCKEYLHLDIEQSVQISNFVGECLDYIKYKGFQKILLVGHTGKLVKLAAGIMNTHSAYADARMEIIGMHSALKGADINVLKQIMECVTTDDAFDLLQHTPYEMEVKDSIMDKVMYHLNYRLKGDAEIEVVMYTNNRSHIMKSKGADRLIEYFREDN